MSKHPHPENSTIFLCLAQNVDSEEKRHIFFDEPQCIGPRQIERGFEDGTLFYVPKMYDFFIRGERRVAYDFLKITDFAIYGSIMKSRSEEKSRSQLLEIIVKDAMEIVIESHRAKKLKGTMKDVREGVKDLQILRANISFPFETEIIQVITETQGVLYEHSMLGEGALFGK